MPDKTSYDSSMTSVRYLLPRMIVIILIVLSIIDCLIMATGFGQVNHVTRIRKFTTTVEFKDGRKEEYDQDAIPMLDAGDMITFHLKIPTQLALEGMSLCFYQYHSVITAWVDGRQIYSYGRMQRVNGWMYGDEYCILPLKSEYAGKTIDIRVAQMEASGSNHGTFFSIVDDDETRWYPMMGNRLYFVAYGSIFMISLISIITLLVLTISHRYSYSAAIFLFLFCFAVSTWELSSKRLFYVLFSNQQICAISEYASLYFCLVPLFLFMGEVKRDKWMRIMYRMMAAAVGTAFAIAMVYHLLGISHLSNFERLVYGVGGSCILLSILAELLVKQTLDTTREKVIKHGYILAGALVLLQVFFIALAAILPPNIILTLINRADMSSIAIIVLMCTFGFVVIQDIMQSRVDLAEEKRTEYMAFHDLLTGMYNRAYCENRMDAVSKDRSYAIIFFDVDRLKYANDNYGHAKGDLLIKVTARMIAKTTEGIDAFAARWGGDEFIMVVQDVNQMALIQKRLVASQTAINGAGIFEFPFSVSYGVAMHLPGEDEDISDVRMLADRRMYESKRTRRVAR